MNRPAVVVAALALVLGGCSGVDEEAAVAVEADSAETSPTFAPTTGPAPTFAPAPEPTTATTAAPAGDGDTPSSSPPRTTTPASGDLQAQIASMPVAPETDSGTYDRDLFGGGWIDADSDGCDTRCEVLAEERRSDLPGLPGGGWLSVFDNYSTDDPSELDIDHMVPLAEAWRSGASRWSGQQRLAFANDLDHPASLIAVTAATNRSKSDGDPAQWQPPNREAWCGYVTDWVATKLRWSLTADEAEVRALHNMSRGC